MGRFFKVIFFLLFLVFVGIQFIEVEQKNFPVTGEIRISVEVKGILKKSCYDCHSNETKWPWYSKIAPISWMIAEDVNKGRKNLNFSEWGKLDFREKGKKLKEIGKQINQDVMPPEKYNYMHPEAKLDVIRKNIILKWIANSGTMN